MKSNHRVSFFQILLLALALLLCGCDRSPEPAPPDNRAAAPAAPAFTILAGSELKELEPALKDAAAQAGLGLQISYAGTLDMVERINAGESFDAILPPNGAYPALALSVKPLAREKLFYSRVALGVKPEALARLRWNAAQPPSWADIAQAAGRGQLPYAMTNPASSNTGMSALFAVASAVAGKTEDLREQEINHPVLKAFLKGQKLTAGSSGWLAEAFARDASQVDAIVNYEAVILRLNEARDAAHKLVLIYPRDGVISADYPLMLLAESRRADYDRLVSAIKSVAFQSQALHKAYLRPAVTEAAPNPALPASSVAELSFPNRLEVIDAVLTAYQSELRRPATSIFVLDTSGSMRGERLAQAQQALKLLSGAQAVTASQRYATFQARERVVLLAFSDSVRPALRIDFGQTALDAGRQQILQFANQLQAQGGTAIYDALTQAGQIAHQEQDQYPDRLVSILLLTDGKNTEGANWQDFRTQLQTWAQKRGPGAQVRIFPIIFGEAESDEMKALAQATGGRAFDARKTALPLVFKEIRGYQ